MRSSDVTAGNTIYASDVNKLRDDAYASSWLLPHEQSTPNLTLYVEAGVYYFNNKQYEFAGGNSPSFTAPASNPRIDILSIDTTGTLVRTAGVENASPVAPLLPAGNFPICQVYNRVSQTQLYDTDQGAGKGYIYKDIRQTMTTLKPVYGGTGADGNLVITSGTTNINVGGAKIYILNYNSISITGTGALTFSNPHATGTIVVIKCKGDCTLTSSAAPMIDCSGMGALGGTGGTQTVSGAHTWGTAGNNGVTESHIKTNTANQQTGGAAGTLTTSVFGDLGTLPSQLVSKYPKMFVGAGGGPGNAVYYSGGGDTITGGNGGNGGGCLIMEVAGAMNFTTTNGISVAGKNGANGSKTGAGTSWAYAAGAGGGGGCAIITYNILTAFSGTVNVAGGVGGNVTSGVSGTWGGSGAGSGGSALNAGSNGSNSSITGTKVSADGGAGLAINMVNTEFF